MRRMGVAVAVGVLLGAVPAAEAAHFPANVRDAGLAPTGQAAAPRTTGGPCTKVASRSMPEGEGHDHSNLAQHRYRCRMRQVFFDSLEDELGARDDVVLGEMDVKNDLAAVAVTFPESGVVLFDVKNPAKPQFLSWYRGSECEQAVMDVNCGAFVDISPEGDVVYLSVQSLSIVPRRAAEARDPAGFGPRRRARRHPRPQEPDAPDRLPGAQRGRRAHGALARDPGGPERRRPARSR